MVLQKYLTSLILSYARRYIRNIEANINLTLWGGDVVLNNLDLRLDVLQRELGVPREFEFSRGFIKELRIHIPWTSLTSRPVEVTFTDVECVLHFKTHVGDYSGGGTGSSSDTRRPRLHSGAHAPPKLEAEEAEEVGGSGWAADLVTKILANMTVKVNGLSFNFVEELQGHRPPPSTTTTPLSHPRAPLVPTADRQIMLSLRIVQMLLQSTNAEYSVQFVELEGPWKLLHKTFELKHVSIHLGELSKELPTNTTQDVAVKTGVSISRPMPRVLSDADDAAILKDLSFTLRIRTYLAALGGTSMIRLPDIDEQPPLLSGAAMTFQLHIHQAAHLYLSDQQLQFLLHIIQTKAGFVATTSHEDKEDEEMEQHLRRTSAPAVISASSLQHLALLEPPLPPSPQLRSTAAPTTMTNGTNAGAPPPAAPAPPPARGWTSWVWDMVAEEDEESDEESSHLPAPSATQDFWTTYGHLAPKDEMILGFQIPSITLHLLHASRHKTQTESGALLGGLTSQSTVDSLLTVKLERITFSQRRCASTHSSAAYAAGFNPLTSPSSRTSSTRTTPSTSSADQTQAAALAAVHGANGGGPATTEGTLRIGDVNVSYIDRGGEVRPMFTWLAHGHPAGPGIVVASGSGGAAAIDSVVLVSEWSTAMLEWEIFAFDLLVPFDLVQRALAVCEPLLRPTTTSKSAPPPPDAAAQRRRRYRPNQRTVKVVLHAGRVRINHVPSSNPASTLSCSAQWQIVHLLQSATQCESLWQYAVLSDTLELRVVDFSVSVEKPTPTFPSQASSAHPRGPLADLFSSSFAMPSLLRASSVPDPASVCLAPLTAVVQVVQRAKVLTVDPEIALYMTAFDAPSLSPAATPAPLPQRVLLPFYRDAHVGVRVQNLVITTEMEQMLHMLAIADAFRLLALAMAGHTTGKGPSAATQATTTASQATVATVPAPDPLLLRQCIDDFRNLKSPDPTALPVRPRPGHILLFDQPIAAPSDSTSSSPSSRCILWKYSSPRAITRIAVASRPARTSDADLAVRQPPLILYGILSAWDPVSCTYKIVFDLLADLHAPGDIAPPLSPPVVASEWKLVWTLPTVAQAEEWARLPASKYRDRAETLAAAAGHEEVLPSASHIAALLRIDSRLHCQTGTNTHVTLSIALGRIALAGHSEDEPDETTPATELLVVHLKGAHSHMRLWENQPRDPAQPHLGTGSALALKIDLGGLWINSHQHVDLTQYPLVLPMRVSVLLRQTLLAATDANGVPIGSFLPAPLADSSSDLPDSSATPSAGGWCTSWNSGASRLSVRTQLLVQPKLISHRVQAFLDHLPSSISRAASQLISLPPSGSNSASPHSSSAAPAAYYIPFHPSGLPAASSVGSGAWGSSSSLSWLAHPPPLSDSQADSRTRWCVDLARLQAGRAAVTHVLVRG